MATVEDLKAMVGKHGSEVKFKIDKSMIRLLCDTLGDDISRWKDVTPPGMLTEVMFVGEGTHIDWPYPGIVDAGAEWNFFKPIKVGDEISVVNSLDGVEDKSSEKGKRLLITFKSTLTNQKGEMVATSIGRVMNLG